MVTYVQEVGAAAMRWLLSGRLYAASVLEPSLADGGSISMLIKNPDSNDRDLMITYIEAGSDGQGTLKIHFDASVSDDGAQITPVALRRPPELSPTFKVFKNPSFTPGNQTLGFSCAGGEGRKSVGSKNGLRPAVFLGPGESVVIEFVNRAGSTVQAHLYVEVHEEM